MIELFIILTILLMGAIVANITISLEKKEFNKGICPNCHTKLYNFDTDSQGGRGYTCTNCNYVTWVSWNCVDEDFNKSEPVSKN